MILTIVKYLKRSCILLPILGIFIAIGFWIAGKGKEADEILFLSFIGILFNLLVVLPLYLVLTFVFLRV